MLCPSLCPLAFVSGGKDVYLCRKQFESLTMFAKETYMERRNRLKSAVGHGLLLFLGNDESGMN